MLKSEQNKNKRKTILKYNAMYLTLNALGVPHKPFCIDSQIVCS